MVLSLIEWLLGMSLPDTPNPWRRAYAIDLVLAAVLLIAATVVKAGSASWTLSWITGWVLYALAFVLAVGVPVVGAVVAILFLCGIDVGGRPRR